MSVPPATQQLSHHSISKSGTGSATTLPRFESKPAFGVRVADVSALRPDGRIVNGQRRVPTLPVFEQALSAFAQGTVLKSKTGFISVEDLQPGDWLATADGQTEQVRWIGSAVFDPNVQGQTVHLNRIVADSFGMSRPDRFLSLGTGARLLQAPPDLRGSTTATHMMTPANRFSDGVNVIDFLPPTPVRLFHVSLRRHSAIYANGLQLESYHPGQNPVSHLSDVLQEAFWGLFPHIQSLSDFGPMRFTRAPEDF